MNFKKIEEDFWASRNDANKYYNWVLGTQRSIWFAQRLKKYKFNSIFEVGLMGGRNIKIINDNIPNLIVGGLDINSDGVKFASEKIACGKFYHMSAFDIDKLEDNYDIIFTMGVMIHLPPDMIYDFCKKLISKTNGTIFHIECSGKNKVINGPKELLPTSGKITNKIRWEPNIVEIYNNLGYKAKIENLPKELKSTDCSSIIEVSMDV